jgi:hypothetical protein
VVDGFFEDEEGALVLREVLDVVESLVDEVDAESAGADVFEGTTLDFLRVTRLPEITDGNTKGGWLFRWFGLEGELEGAAIFSSVGVTQNIRAGFIHGQSDQHGFIGRQSEWLQEVAQVLADGAEVAGSAVEGKFDHSGW